MHMHMHMHRYTHDQFAYMTSEHRIFLFCMQLMQLIPNEFMCERCGSSCTLAVRPRSETDREDWYHWRCNACKGRNIKTFALLKGGVFAGLQDPRKLIQFVYFHLQQMPHNRIVEMLNIGANRGTSWKQELQEAFVAMNTHITTKLGNTAYT